MTETLVSAGDLTNAYNDVINKVGALYTNAEVQEALCIAIGALKNLDVQASIALHQHKIGQAEHQIRNSKQVIEELRQRVRYDLS